MNSAAVSKTPKLKFIKELNIPPSPGDSGSAIGAAYYGFIQKNKENLKNNFPKKNIINLPLLIAFFCGFVKLIYFFGEQICDRVQDIYLT